MASTPHQVPLVEMRNISKHFGGLKALQNVDLVLAHNEILSVVGDNAAGKSTLMKVLSGVYRPSEGRIFIEGKEVEIRCPEEARRLGIEMVYQDLALIEDLDVKANIFLGREIERCFLKGLIKMLDEKTMAKESSVILKKTLDLDIPSCKTLIKSLSGGQRQGVAIARAVRFNPKVIIMDEPTASLSLNKTKKVHKLIARLKKQGISVIIVSHRPQEVFTVADRMIVLSQGEKIGDVKTSEITLEDIAKLMVSTRNTHQ